MNCSYCDRIAAADPGYQTSAAVFDLGSAAPRCPRHWRYLCGKCNRPAHFMSTAYDVSAGRFYCVKCATGGEEVAEPFWAWGYHYRYRSPFSGQWHVSLDRLEFEGMHPLQRYAGVDVHPSVSREPHLERYPETNLQWAMDHVPDDDEIKASWDRNADRWDAGYDDDGDRNRRYQSDEPMLAMLGDVKGRQVLDAGCGVGYLCRKLARMGAAVAGVELSQRFFELATKREATDRLGIRYVQGSITSMPFAKDASFDKVVSNYVLMDVRDYEQAVAEVHRVLRPGGAFVAVISHPCFACGPSGWVKPAADSPRVEERGPHLVDRYFHRGPIAGVWGGFDPVIGFHRPLRDYWETFARAGFAVTGFDEPSVTDRGRRELSAARVEACLRIPYSCIFRLEKR